MVRIILPYLKSVLPTSDGYYLLYWRQIESKFIKTAWREIKMKRTVNVPEIAFRGMNWVFEKDYLVVVVWTISLSTRKTGWLGSARGVVMDVGVLMSTVGITSDRPWKLRFIIQFLGSQICVGHWKLLVGIFTFRNSFSSTGSRWTGKDTTTKLVFFSY